MFYFYSLREEKYLTTFYWPPTGTRLLQILVFFIVTTTHFFSFYTCGKTEGLNHRAR